MSTNLMLDPMLPMSPREFAAAWNTDPRTDDLAKAELRTAGLDPGSLDGAGAADVDELVVLETAAANMVVSASAFYDLIRDVLEAGGVAGQVQIDEQAMPDGGVLLRVTAAAES
jgi:hypothetical protein